VVEHVLGFVVRQFFFIFFFGYTVVVYACVFLFNHYIYLVVDLALLGLGQVVEVKGLCASMTHAPPLFSMVSSGMFSCFASASFLSGCPTVSSNSQNWFFF
jgi:predicted ABC-type sugar transport system permease subunit